MTNITAITSPYCNTQHTVYMGHTHYIGYTHCIRYNTYTVHTVHTSRFHSVHDTSMVFPSQSTECNIYLHTVDKDMILGQHMYVYSVGTFTVYECTYIHMYVHVHTYMNIRIYIMNACLHICTVKTHTVGLYPYTYSTYESDYVTAV